eukprot:scaffold327_cov78-Amphora_coffeaeformis.AAC.1
MRFDRQNIAFPQRHEVEEVVLVVQVVRVVSRDLQTLSNLGNQISFCSKIANFDEGIVRQSISFSFAVTRDKDCRRRSCVESNITDCECYLRICHDARYKVLTPNESK